MMKKLRLSQISLCLFVLSLLPAQSDAQYNVTVTSAPYAELTGATQLSYSSTDDGYYYQANFIFPVFGGRMANFNLDISNGSNGGFMTSQGYLAVYESPGYDNTIVFQCLYDSDFKTVAGITQASAKLEGTAPNRIAKFQWKNLVNGTDTSQRISFQAWLHEANSTVSYHYGPNTFPSNANQGFCGIVVFNPTFTALLNECNAEGNPAAPAVYDSITTMSLPTLDSLPLNGTVITFGMAPTAVTEVALEHTFDFYPNPTSGIINVHAENIAAGAYSLSIQNMLGQTIYTRNVQVVSGVLDEKLSLLPYADGIYTLQLKGNGVHVARKIEKR